MNLQVTVLKILISYPDGFASMPDLKRDMAILATSGPDWAAPTKRMGARVPGLDIFSQGLIERVNRGWRITDKGRAVLEVMEARSSVVEKRIDEDGPAAGTNAAAEANVAAKEPVNAATALSVAAKADRRAAKRRQRLRTFGNGRAIRS
ncbi:winged helix-turn-helix domain-containing protein [Bradyrhizobium sp. C-145]|uniref:winged helix-turn-helix domain-containing protein n=1 Tax=Bradyrhizobium sp. C-145 TaxID=574727 RepID=UPI00201B72CB|nr:winged helix-turn-helix domain-containing protein [Bradyrhizobium sp. C-145]UQR64861.1 winged helix-turn-helix domain-containing protein [Bradyrhizobium sp. C-145]